MITADQYRTTEAALENARILKNELNKRLLVTINDPIDNMRLKFDLECLDREINRLETTLTQPVKAEATPKIVPTRRLRIYLAGWSSDYARARALYARLQSEGYEPWFEDEDLPFSGNRQQDLEQAIRASDMIVICFSVDALNQLADYFQNVLEQVLTLAQAASIPLVIAKLDQCELKNPFQSLPSLNYYEPKGYDRLIKGIQIQSRKLGLTLPDPSFKETRWLDGALPARVVRGKTTELVVMLRLSESEGLAGLLRDRPRKYSSTPKDVTSEDFVVDYRHDDQGNILPLDLWISLQPTGDFELLDRRKKVRLQPGRDSEPFLFLVTPLKTGELRLIIDITVEDDTCLASGRLLVNGTETSDEAGIPGTVLVSLPVGAVGVGAALNAKNQPGPEAAVSGGLVSGGGLNASQDAGAYELGRPGHSGGNSARNGGGPATLPQPSPEPEAALPLEPPSSPVANISPSRPIYNPQSDYSYYNSAPVQPPTPDQGHISPSQPGPLPDQSRHPVYPSPNQSVATRTSPDFLKIATGIMSLLVVAGIGGLVLLVVVGGAGQRNPTPVAIVSSAPVTSPVGPVTTPASSITITPAPIITPVPPTVTRVPVTPTRAPIVTPTPVTIAPARRNPYQQVFAFTRNEQRGTAEVESKEEKGVVVTRISNGDFLLFNNVDFGEGGLKSLDVRLASGLPETSLAANIPQGTIQFWIDGAPGVTAARNAQTQIGEVPVFSTGSFQNWKTFPGKVSNTRGVHNLYAVFVSAQQTDFVAVNWFQFSR